MDRRGDRDLHSRLNEVAADGHVGQARVHLNRDVARDAQARHGDGERRAGNIGDGPAAASTAPSGRLRFTGYKKFLDPDGYPATAPPWGTLNAIDLATGTGNDVIVTRSDFHADYLETDVGNDTVTVAGGYADIALMGAGTLGVQRRHADITFAGQPLAYEYPEIAKGLMDLGGERRDDPQTPAD